MKAPLLVAVTVLAGLSGCVDPTEDTPPEFDITCPQYITAENLHPKWRNEALIYDADGETEGIRQKEQRDKWIVEPTIQGGYNYRDGRLAYVDFDISVDGIADAFLYFEAYRASPDEPAATPQGEDVMPPTGDRLLWQDPSQGFNGPLFSQVKIGPAYGNEEEDILRWINGTYRVTFPVGTDPSRIRIDAFFEADQDDDPTTDSAAVYTISASFWWTHADCV